MKKLLSIFLTFTMLISATAVLSVPAPANAASKRTKALKAYKRFLKKNKNYNRFALIYLDKDKTPELLVSTNYIVSLYSYSKGKIIDSLTTNHIEYTNNKFLYYKRSGFFKSEYMRAGIYTKGYTKVVKGKIKSIIGYRQDSMTGKKEYYKLNSNSKRSKVKSSVYKNYVKKFNKKKISAAKFFSNTKSGRAKHCK